MELLELIHDLDAEVLIGGANSKFPRIVNGNFPKHSVRQIPGFVKGRAYGHCKNHGECDVHPTPPPCHDPCYYHPEPVC